MHLKLISRVRVCDDGFVDKYNSIIVVIAKLKEVFKPRVK